MPGTCKIRCVQHRAVLLLGSATPAVESMYQAREGRYRLFTLSQRFNQQAMPQVRIVDMKRELRAGNCTAISAELRRELACNLERGEQSILFLNRRGSSRMVSCGECGQVPECPRCSVRLTYHSANGRLMCHYCGYSEPLPPACPSCGGRLNFIGVGTQRVQEELEALFPGIEILRMDADTISAAHPHEELLSRFQKQRVPILVGTQMVAKGLDFDNVTLVGVVDADLSLYAADFRAGERTFSLITQVVGRAGRGEKRGRAVIQTYTPDNDVIRFAAGQDYDSFYEQEIQLRRLRDEPPFRDILVLTASGPDEAGVLRVCTRLRQFLERELPKLPDQSFRLLGPAPAVIARVNNRYRYPPHTGRTGQPPSPFPDRRPPPGGAAGPGEPGDFCICRPESHGLIMQRRNVSWRFERSSKRGTLSSRNTAIRSHASIKSCGICWTTCGRPWPRPTGWAWPAPQVGILRRAVLVVNDQEEMLELINPEIIASEGEEDGLEGCLSVARLLGLCEASRMGEGPGLRPERK